MIPLYYAPQTNPLTDYTNIINTITTTAMTVTTSYISTTTTTTTNTAIVTICETSGTLQAVCAYFGVSQSDIISA